MTSDLGTPDLTRWSTWREIQAQPDIWAAWGAQADIAGLRAWVAAQSVDEVWFCGAGTSAYIGDVLAAAHPTAQSPRLRSVPSTDLVADPVAWLPPGARPLVVSFGRSGNSAESLGTLDALDARAPQAPRLHITCNPDGALARRASSGPLRVVSLPEATHDAGFAMTSSFSTMLLTALAIFDPHFAAPEGFAARMTALAGQMRTTLRNAPMRSRPARAVYLGSGPLAFAAREAALKVMELTAGQTPALWDSTLGFRHGPKSFVTKDTAVTVFLSPQNPTARYDADLVAELRAQFPQTRVTTAGPGGDMPAPMPFGPAWAVPVCVALAQLDGVRWSADLGLNVDDPFAGQGTLSRVVSGVTLYPVTP